MTRILWRSVVIVASCACVASCFAPPPQRVAPTRRIEFEAIALPDQRSDSGTVIAQGRIDSRFFVVTKSDKTNEADAYRGEIEVTTEVYARGGELLRSHTSMQEIDIRADDAGQPSGASFIFVHQHRLRAGDYLFVVRATDRQSQREQSLERTVTLKRWDRVPRIDCIMPLATFDSVKRMVRASGRSGDVEFTKRPLFIAQGSGVDAGRIAIALRERGDVKEQNHAHEMEIVSPARFRNHRLSVEDLRRELQYRLTPSEGMDCIMFSLPLDTLDVGKYQLEIIVTANDESDTLAHDFSVVWYDAPRSLGDISYAIDAMQHILTPPERDAMLSGDEKKQRVAFFNYWRSHDPTPATKWNEHFVEYFRRVDAARTLFKTVKIFDGVFTARGKVYILNGPAESVERLLPPEGMPLEVWEYPSLGKRFLFADPDRNGNYLLKREERM